MSLLQSIMLGLTQGLTEFFPISSSGHLVILPWLFRWNQHPLSFDIMLHFATFFAIVIYFRKDWANILREGFLSIRERALRGSLERRLFWYIIIASLPGVIIGSTIGDKVEDYLRNPMLIAVMLGIFGLILYLAELYGKGNRSLPDFTWLIALAIGFSQMLAIIPGVSRSGITISAAMLLGMNSRDSVRFSFLLCAPVIFAAACYGIGTAVSQSGGGSVSGVFSLQVALPGFIASFLSSLIAIHVLLNYVRRHPFTVFVIYRLAASVVIISIFYLRG